MQHLIVFFCYTSSNAAGRAGSSDEGRAQSEYGLECMMAFQRGRLLLLLDVAS